MKVKTNVRAGQGGADDVVDTSSSTSTSSSNQNRNQKGKTTYTPPVSRCVGI